MGWKKHRYQFAASAWNHGDLLVWKGDNGQVDTKCRPRKDVLPAEKSAVERTKSACKSAYGMHNEHNAPCRGVANAAKCTQCAFAK